MPFFKNLKKNLLIILILSFCSCKIVFAAENVSVLLDKIIKNYKKVESYSTIMESISGNTETIMEYSFKQPGYVKMKFIKPHKGARLSYDPLKRKVVIHPFESMPFIKLTLDPGNSMIKSPGGHTVDKSDTGALLDALKKLYNAGGAGIISEIITGGYKNYTIQIKCRSGFALNGINKYIIAINTKDYFPYDVKAFDKSGELIEHMALKNLEINYEK